MILRESFPQATVIIALRASPLDFFGGHLVSPRGRNTCERMIYGDVLNAVDPSQSPLFGSIIL